MPSAPVVSVRVPCIDGLVIVTETPGMTAPLASVILPLMAPVVVLTVWPSAAATDPKTRTRTNTGTWQCSRLMRLLRDRNTQRPRDLTPSVARPTVISDGHYTRFRGNAIAFRPARSPFERAGAGSWMRRGRASARLDHPGRRVDGDVVHVLGGSV